MGRAWFLLSNAFFWEEKSGGLYISVSFHALSCHLRGAPSNTSLESSRGGAEWGFAWVQRGESCPNHLRAFTFVVVCLFVLTGIYLLSQFNKPVLGASSLPSVRCQVLSVVAVSGDKREKPGCPGDSGRVKLQKYPPRPSSLCLGLPFLSFLLFISLKKQGGGQRDRSNPVLFPSCLHCTEMTRKVWAGTPVTTDSRYVMLYKQGCGKQAR